jgi:chemotaxis protein MotB
MINKGSMKIIKIVSLMLLLVVLGQACVSRKMYNSLQSDYDSLNVNTKSLRDKFRVSQQRLSLSEERVKSLDKQLASEKANLLQLQIALDKCLTSSGQGNVNISKLVDEINASNKYIKQLVDSKNKSDSLNLLLTNNLTRSLSREELKDVDVQVLKGVVYISLSDKMLYRSGSYMISETAGDVLSKIAKIIKDYKGYDVLVEGNTDNVPISMINIRNNWDLSALRGSSVVQALQNQYGVDPKRLTVGGRGEYNPLASNDTEMGKSKNRRTQIIITPSLDQFMELIEKAPAESSN